MTVSHPPFNDQIALLQETFPAAVACPTAVPEWALRLPGVASIYAAKTRRHPIPLPSFFIRTPGYELGLVECEKKSTWDEPYHVEAHLRQAFAPHTLSTTTLTAPDDIIGWLSYAQEHLVEVCYGHLAKVFNPKDFFSSSSDLLWGMSSFFTLRAMGIPIKTVIEGVHSRLTFPWENNNKRFECRLLTSNDSSNITPDMLTTLMTPRNLFFDSASKEPYKGGKLSCVVHDSASATAKCAILFPGDMSPSLSSQAQYEEFPWSISNKASKYSGTQNQLLEAAEKTFVRFGLKVFSTWIGSNFIIECPNSLDTEKMISFLDKLAGGGTKCTDSPCGHT